MPSCATRCSRFGRRASTSRSSRLRRSATSGSRTGRDRRKSAPSPLEGRGAPGVPGVVLARRAARSPERGSRSRALAPLGSAGAEDPEAVRVAALGDGRRARVAGRVVGAKARSARSHRGLPLEGARRARTRARRTRRADHPERRCDSRRGGRAGRSTACSLRRAAVRGEGHSRVSRGDGGHRSRHRRRRPAARSCPRRRRFRPAARARRVLRAARRSSSARLAERATASPRARPWLTGAR